MNRIGIIGCGWLGMPLAIHLRRQGFEVHGTTTRAEKLILLSKHDIHGYVFQLPIDNDKLFGSQLWSCDTYLINIPPGRRNPNDVASYPERIRNLTGTLLATGSNPRIIFISSTGVYQNTSSFASEMSPLVKEEDSVILQAEQLVRMHFDNNVILRMSGLIGPERHPGNWFAGKMDIPGGHTPINIVHQKDCIEIITRVIMEEEIKGVYNVCSDEHPEKQAFYTKMSKLLGLTMPVFLSGVVPYKIVENQKLKEKIDFRYEFSNPLSFTFE